MKYTIDDYNFEGRLSQKTKEPIPNTLFRYFSINENNVTALENFQLWASQPDSFNDLFESLRHRTVLYPSDFEIIKQFYSDKKVNPDLLQDFSTNPEKREFIRDDLYRYFIETTGIICTTKTNCNDLMWAHYSNNERFSVGLNHGNLSDRFYGPYEINYLETKSDILDFKSTNPFQTIALNALSKRTIWSYENEFRIISSIVDNKPFEIQTGFFENSTHQYPKSSRLIKVDNSVFQNISLGFHFFTPHLTEKRGIVKFDMNTTSLLKQRILDFGLKNNLPFMYLKIDPDSLIAHPFDIKISQLDNSIYKVIELDRVSLPNRLNRI